MRTRLLSSIVLLAFALCRPGAAAAQGGAYTIVDLGTLGGARSSAVSLNNAGHVVGNAETADGSTRAFLYTGGTLTDLGTFGGANSNANRISDGGLIVGRAQDASGTYRPFLNLSGGPMWDLGSIDARLKDRFSAAVSINARGDIVGYLQTTTHHMAARSRVFLFRDFRLIDLGTFGGEDGVVAAINDAGQLVGYFGTEPHADYADHQAFLMSGNTVTNLGNLGARITTPTDINNRGHVVGFAQVRGGEDHAFLYSGGAIVDLGTLSGGSQSYAYAINDSGKAVGASDSSSGGLRAVLFEGGAIVDLKTLLPGTSGWALTEAHDINESGQITGTGVLNGEQRAFLMTPVK